METLAQVSRMLAPRRLAVKGVDVPDLPYISELIPVPLSGIMSGGRTL
jgi:hypothetical protein